ncbi:MAG TPA: FeoB-associated Cys-rich membrane protein [Acholeplasmataceae bacterium]|jgi:hypothetical protein|nr:FeoB-associated Cys-rich membrane protein [Acholeplasmataceae bacterium]
MKLADMIILLILAVIVFFAVRQVIASGKDRCAGCSKCRLTKRSLARIRKSLKE